MKLVAGLAACLFTPYLHAATLLQHIAFASSDIKAECSDYLGKVSAGRDIELRDFLISERLGLAGCPLSAGGDVRFVRGTVEKARARGCVAGQRLEASQLAYGGARRGIVADPLTIEMSQLSQRLEALPGARVVPLETADYPGTGTIEIKGHAQELVILRSFEMDPSLMGMGVKLTGGVGPANIVWDFPLARSLRIKFVGHPSLGVPGTVLAPNARVYFQNALITGALYAETIIGEADRVDCTGLRSGQINPAPLRLPSKP